MIRTTRLAAVVLLAIATLCGPGAGVVSAQMAAAPAVPGVPLPRPRIRGRQHRLKIDSSPQQAAVYWDVGGPASAPRSYGIAGYTPITLKVPRGPVKIIVELAGWKAQEQNLDVRKSQTVSFTLERAPQMARLDLRASSDGGAAGAEVFIDGVDRGTAPNTFEVTAGRHQLELKKDGYKPFSDWLDLAEGERRTRDVSMVRAEAPSGTLLVMSDQGGDVYLDGARKDVAPAIVAVPAGDHVVEVRKDGLPPWRQTVTVVAGQQIKVSASFGAPVATGGSSLRVIANEPDVAVFVDGEDKGHAPVTVSDIKPGEHIVGARKKTFKPQEQTVRVAAGESAIVNFKMEAAPPDRPHAALKVQSMIPNAEVFLDGSSLGRAPVDRADLDPGKHYVVVHRDGYTDFKREVILVENQSVALVADLSATGALRILSTPEGAEVRLDGELIGKTPVSRDTIPSGDHIVEFKLPGYYDHKETMKVEGGREKVFSVDLKIIPTGPTPEQRAKRRQAMSSVGAKVNPVGGVTVDFGLGYPYYIMTRVMVGALQNKYIGFDVGVQVRTMFDITDIALRGRVQLLEAGPFALGVDSNVIGFGTGVNGRATIFGDYRAIASLAFADIATVSAFAHLSWWDDHFCPTAQQIANGTSADAYCSPTLDPTNYMKLFPSGDPTAADVGHRFYTGIAASASFDRLTSFFFEIEFLPFTDIYGFTPRKAYEGTYNQDLIGTTDHGIYFQAGLTLKF
ncbi:MAG TPA: PEGA domain-containing protein [Polyangia bacterium]|nr:PEGA domain-containing protein [Polyangia bacterium]